MIFIRRQLHERLLMPFTLKVALISVVLFGAGLMAAENTLAVEKNKVRSSARKNVVSPTIQKKKVMPVVKARLTSPPAKEKESIGRLAVHSGTALVVDQSLGDALFQKNANAIVPIASITKLMTAMVALDSAPNLQALLTISDDDVDYLRGSRSRLNVGSVLTRETALMLALMSSENRAAHALARFYPGGMPAFLTAMNIKAQALGMRDTRFEDPTGLTSSNVSTAYDLVRMVTAAYRYPLIREFSTLSEAKVEISGRELAYRNTNPLVKNMAWDVGLSKTGYIHEAGKCLVMQARVADKPVVIVLLDSTGKMTRVGDANRIKRWMESTHLTTKNSAHATLSREPLPGVRQPG